MFAIISNNIIAALLLVFSILHVTVSWGPKPSITEASSYSEIEESTVLPGLQTTTEDTDSVCSAADTQATDCGKLCKSDDDCRNNNRRCMCDLRCGLTCVKIDKLCPKLRAPENGMMKISGRVYGSKALFACREGFKLVGVRRSECQSDGLWTGAQPICIEQSSSAYCERAPNISHALHNGTSEQQLYPVGDLLIYRCQPGYQIHGMFVESKCLSYNETAKWFGPDVRCEPVSCQPPRQLANGAANFGCTSYQCQIEYECNDGFELSGQRLAVCQSDGSWSSPVAPSCKPIQCVSPVAPLNGHVRVTSLSFDSVIGYSCRQGYMLVGESNRRCQANRQWSAEDPVCEAPSQIDCGSPGPLYNGWVGGNSTAMGAQVTFNCNEKTVRVGLFETAICSSNGRWSHPMPNCMGPCGLPKVSQGRLANETIANLSSEDVIPHGEKLSVKCDDGYEIHLSGESPRCHNGSWTHMPICAPARCKTLPAVGKHSFAIVPRNTHGSRARFVCKDGYSLTGARFATCHFGQWTGDNHDCEIVYCKFPGSVEHGSVLLVGNMGLYDYRAYVRKVRNNRMITYKCDRGYTLSNGPPGATCVNGNWQPSHLPVCVPDQHPMLTTWLTDRTIRDVSGRALNAARHHHLHTEASSVSAATRLRRWTDIVFGTSTDEASLEAAESALNTTEKIPTPSSSSITEVTGANITNLFEISSEITSDRDGDSVEKRISCGPPTLANETVGFHHDRHANVSNTSYTEDTQITFECVFDDDMQRVSWKLTCRNGSWIAKPYSCESDYDSFDPYVNQTCTISTKLKNVMTFLNDQPVLEDKVEFAAGTQLVFRCVDIGKYMLMGSSIRQCRRGTWTGVSPACYGLNQMHDYALERPPTILFRHDGGAIAQTNDGKLAVVPGTILHLECLWIRKFGKPSWEISHKRKKYTQGWTTEPGRDSNLEYRLSIHNAQASDSGVYTCVTPQRHRHHVEIEVKEVRCDAIRLSADLSKSSHSVEMSAMVNFSCGNGNSLVGAQSVTCLPSGNWSAPIPYCDNIECPLIEPADSSVKVTILSRQVAGKAMFECPRGYERVGAADAYCQSNGKWSQNASHCRELLCETPPVPENGFLSPTEERYMVGDIVQFSCRRGYMLDGTPLIQCQTNQQWSDEPPTCVEACMYPGSTIGGILSPVKFYYRVGEVVALTCAGTLQLSGSDLLECRTNGLWSAPLPQCVAD